MEQEALSAAAQQFTDAGATLVLISPQLPEHSAAIAEEKGLNIDILSDPGNDVAARYGLKYQMPADLIAIYQQFGRFVCQHNALINNIIDILGDVSGYFNGPDNVPIFKERIGRN